MKYDKGLDPYTEKLYINSFPVWRTELNDTIEYVLFENNKVTSPIINIAKDGKDFIDEYKIILKFISDNTEVKDNFKLGIRIRYENRN